MAKGKPLYLEYGELLKKTIVPEDTDRNSYKEVFNWVEEKAPKKLYRFRDCNKRNFNALKTNRIYFNTPNNFNDPHDCLIYIDYDRLEHEIKSIDPVNIFNILKKSITQKSFAFDAKSFLPSDVYQHMNNKLLHHSDILDQNLQHIQEGYQSILNDLTGHSHSVYTKIVNYLRESTKIACFSMNIKETLMWSYYANSHKGFALEYNFNDLTSKVSLSKGKHKNTTYSLYPVVYTDQRYDATDFAEYFLSKDILDKLPIVGNSGIKLPDKLVFQKASTYKGRCWKHEKEWRMILNTHPDSNSNWVRCKPTSIYLGANIEERYESTLIQQAKKLGISIFKMDVLSAKNKYSLSYHLVYSK